MFSGRVKFDFEARSGKELSVKKGESLLVIRNDDSSSWVRAQNGSGQVGAVPREFVVRDEFAVVNQQAKAAFAYSPAEGRVGHLTLAKGDSVLVLARLTKDWWKGRVVGSLAEGLFPAAYVKLESRPPTTESKLELRVKINVNNKEFVGELPFDAKTTTVAEAGASVAKVAKLRAPSSGQIAYSLYSPDSQMFLQPTDTLHDAGLAAMDLVDLVDCTSLLEAANSAIGKSTAAGGAAATPSPAAAAAAAVGSKPAATSAPSPVSGSQTSRSSRRSEKSQRQGLSTLSSESSLSERDPADDSTSSSRPGSMTWRGPSSTTAAAPGKLAPAASPGSVGGKHRKSPVPSPRGKSPRKPKDASKKDKGNVNTTTTTTNNDDDDDDDDEIDYDAGKNEDDEEIVNFVDKDGNPAELHNAAWVGDTDLLKELLVATDDQGVRRWDPNQLDSEDNTPLHYAAFKGRVALVQCLLNAGADVDPRDADGSTPLHHAAFHSHGPIVGLLASAGADPNARDSEGGTALHNACANGDAEIVRSLLQSGAKATVRDANGATSLHYSAFGGSVDCLELLLQSIEKETASADSTTPKSSSLSVNAQDHNKETALIVASRRGHVDCVQCLLSKQADVHLKSLKRQTALHAAAAHGHSGAVAALLGSGADVHAKDGSAATPLHKAAWSGDAQTIKVLLDAGAIVDVVDAAQTTPLLNASFGGHVAACRLILAADPKAISHRDADGGTALHNSVYNGHVACADFLLRHGAPVDAKDNQGATPLMFAGFFGQRRLTNLLLRKGASVNAVDKQGRTALHLAAFKGHSFAVQLFLLAGADPDVRTGAGLSPLAMASYAGSLASVLLLESAGAPLDQKDAKGLTPLHLAASRNCSDIALFLLLKAPELLERTDVQQRTALHLAARAGHEDCASLLLENGASLTVQAKDGATPVKFARRTAKKALAPGGDRSRVAADKLFKRLRTPDPRVSADASIAKRLNTLVPERRQGRMKEYKVMNLMETNLLFGGTGSGDPFGVSAAGVPAGGTAHLAGAATGADSLKLMLDIDPSSRGEDAFVYPPLNIDLNSVAEMAVGVERAARQAGVFGTWANLLRHLLVIPYGRRGIARYMWQLVELFAHRVIVQKASDEEWEDDQVKLDPDMFAELHSSPPALDEDTSRDVLDTVLDAMLLLFPGLKRPKAARGRGGTGDGDEADQDPVDADDDDDGFAFKAVSPEEKARRMTKSAVAASAAAAVEESGALESRLASMLNEDDDDDAGLTAAAAVLGDDQEDPSAAGPSGAPSPPPMPNMAGGAPPPPPMPGGGGPPPPPPPGGMPKGPKLRRFNWVKIPVPKLPGTVFDDAVASSSPAVAVALAAVKKVDVGSKQLEKTYFVKKAKALGAEKAANKQVAVVDSKRAQTIGILWTRMRLPASAVADAIETLDEKALSLDDVRSLGKCAPTKEEMDALRKLDDVARRKLGPTEQIFLQLMRVDKLDRVLNCWLFKREFDGKLADILADIELVNSAVRELRRSTRLATLLRVVLNMGNVLNGGYFGGAAKGYKLQSLIRLRDTKSTDNKSNLLQYVIELLIKYDRGPGAATAAKIAKQLSANKATAALAAAVEAARLQAATLAGLDEPLELTVSGGVSEFFTDLPHVDQGTKVRLDHASSLIDELKTGLTQVTELLKDAGEDVLYRGRLQEFETKALSRVDMLQKTVTKVRQRYQDASTFFGEDFLSDDFVEFAGKFVELYKKECEVLAIRQAVDFKRTRRAKAAAQGAKAKREDMAEADQQQITRKLMDDDEDDDDDGMFKKKKQPPAAERKPSPYAAQTDASSHMGNADPFLQRKPGKLSTVAPPPVKEVEEEEKEEVPDGDQQQKTVDDCKKNDDEPGLAPDMPSVTDDADVEGELATVIDLD